MTIWHDTGAHHHIKPALRVVLPHNPGGVLTYPLPEVIVHCGKGLCRWRGLILGQALGNAQPQQLARGGLMLRVATCDSWNDTVMSKTSKTSSTLPEGSQVQIWHRPASPTSDINLAACPIVECPCKDDLPCRPPRISPVHQLLTMNQRSALCVALSALVIM